MTGSMSQKSIKPKRKSSWSRGSYLAPKNKRKSNIPTGTPDSHTNDRKRKVSKSSKPRSRSTDSRISIKRIKVEPGLSDDCENAIKVKPQMVENPYVLLFEQTAEDIMQSEMNTEYSIMTRKRSSIRNNHLQSSETFVEEDDSAIELEDPLGCTEENLNLVEDENSQNDPEHTNYSILKPNQVEDLIFVESLFNTNGGTYSEANNYRDSSEFIAPETANSEDLFKTSELEPEIHPETANNEYFTEEQLESNNNVDFNDSTNFTNSNTSDITKNANPEVDLDETQGMRLEDDDDNAICNRADNCLLQSTLSQEQIECEIVPEMTFDDSPFSTFDNNDNLYFGNDIESNEAIFSEHILAENDSTSLLKEQTEIHEIDLTRSNLVEENTTGNITQSKRPILSKSDVPNHKQSELCSENEGRKDEIMKKSLLHSDHPYSFYGKNKHRISSKKRSAKNRLQINNGSTSKKKGLTKSQKSDLLKLVRNCYPELTIDISNKPKAKSSSKLTVQTSSEVISKPLDKAIKMPLPKLIRKPSPEPAREFSTEFKQYYSSEPAPGSTQDLLPEFLHKNLPGFTEDSSPELTEELPLKNRPSIMYKYNQVNAVCRKRKIKSEKDSFVKCSNDSMYRCENCDFIANNEIDLEIHLLCHTIRQKCCYCSFITFENFKMKDHWEVEHQAHEFRFEEAVVTNFLGGSCKLDDGSPRPTITVYYCFYCDVKSFKVDELHLHWESFHADNQEKLIFKYKEITERQFKCAYCGEATTKAMMENHISEEHGVDAPIWMMEDDEGWICNVCTESMFLITKEEIEKHQSLYHSELNIEYKPVRRIFKCHSCDNFESSSFKSMQEHAKKNHIMKFKCDQCSEMMMSFNDVNTHFKLEHPSSEYRVAFLSRDEIAKEANQFVATSTKYVDVEFPCQNEDVFNFYDNNAELEMLNSPNYGYSYYGQDFTPVDLSEYRTNLVLTGMNVKRVSEVKCDKLAKILDINLNPTLKLLDCMKIKMDECKGYSYYSQVVEPVDLRDFNTKITLTGMNKNKTVKVDCAKCSKILMIDLEPNLKIEDCMKQDHSSRELENLIIDSEKMSDESDLTESNGINIKDCMQRMQSIQESENLINECEKLSGQSDSIESDAMKINDCLPKYQSVHEPENLINECEKLSGQSDSIKSDAMKINECLPKDQSFQESDNRMIKDCMQKDQSYQELENLINEYEKVSGQCDLIESDAMKVNDCLTKDESFQESGNLLNKCERVPDKCDLKSDVMKMKHYVQKGQCFQKSGNLIKECDQKVSDECHSIESDGMVIKDCMQNDQSYQESENLINECEKVSDECHSKENDGTMTKDNMQKGESSRELENLIIECELIIGHLKS